MEIKHPLPPFTKETALQKVQMAEDAWNSRDPEKISMAYTQDSHWRNRSQFIEGRESIRTFLSGKWVRELNYRLKKTLWSFTDNRIAVTFFYEWHDAKGNWFRSYGNKLWEFNAKGLMRKRIASISDVLLKKVSVN